MFLKEELMQSRYQPEPPDKPSFTKENGLSLIIAIIALFGGLFTLISAILGKIIIVDFNWFVAILAISILAILIAVIWYDNTARRKHKDQSAKDIAAIKAEYEAQVAGIRQELKTMQNEYLKIIEGDRKMFDQWQQGVIQANQNFSQDQEERLKDQNLKSNHDFYVFESRLMGEVITKLAQVTDWQNDHIKTHEKQTPPTN
jgi:membrane protein implicated in regulation of membrane protease activity